MEFNEKQFVKATGAKVLQRGASSLCGGLSTDTRGLKTGTLFFALSGPNFDGHAFCEEAVKRGAWGVVITKRPTSNVQRPNKNIWIFQVSDTLKALGDIGQWWRGQFSIPCVAITGSNGKTTTKEMTAAILSTKWNCLQTEGNFNNLIGLPLTLDRLGASHEASVLEMGMNDFGEIRRLTEIAAPTVGVVTNAAAAHLEKLHTVEAVAKAKTELYEAMSPEGIAVYNAEDEWLSKKVQAFPGKKISFGMKGGSDVSFEHMESQGFDRMELKLTVEGKLLQTTLQTTGVHNVMNAMAACSAAVGLGFDLDLMKQGLEKFKPLKMRFEQIQLANGVRLVNDAYNANPVSMEAAFATVGRAKRAGKFIAVLGDMKELGDSAAEWHQEVGKKAVQGGVERIFAIGEFAAFVAKGALSAGLNPEKVTAVKLEEEVVQKLEKELAAGDVVLVKASRAMRLESIVEALKERFGI